MISIPSIFYLLSSSINLVLPLEGFFKLHKKKEQHVLRGGFIFFNALHLVAWLIYGFLSKTFKHSNPIFFATSIFYVCVSIILFKEYPNLVYHNVILINYAWWLRQQKKDLILKMNLFTTGLFLIVPHIYTIRNSLRYKDKKYISPIQIIGNFISAICYSIFCISEGFWILVILNGLKIIILITQWFVYKKLDSQEKITEKLKKAE